MSPSAQASRYRRAGASPEVATELAAYDAVGFELPPDTAPIEVPLGDEPFVACWREWCDESRRRGVVPTLSRYLPQLSFPVRPGISQEEGYRGATLRGEAAVPEAGATGLDLERPKAVGLDLYPSIAGRVPVLTVRHRPDFVALVRALARRNEPAPVPESQGAAMIAGLPNWERIRRYRRAWEQRPAGERGRGGWTEEFARLRRRPELFQDRLVLLSDGPYSDVTASQIGLEPGHWRELSLTIRRDHECCHYFTRRAFGKMRIHVLDELMADHAGIVAAVGRFRADWGLRFLGLEEEEGVRPGGRLELYRGDPPLSDAAFAALAGLVRRAALAVERFDASRWPGAGERGLADRTLAAHVLARSELAELAADEAPELLSRRAEELAGRIVPRGSR